MVNEKRLVDQFLQLVRIDGVSGREEKIAREVKSRLEELGLQVDQDSCHRKFGGQQGNVLCRVPGKGAGTGVTVLLAAHLDVIASVKGIETVIDSGVIRTAGETILGADDRAGVAILLEILHVLKEQDVDHPALEVLFTVGEESGLYGAKYLELPLKARWGIVLDSGGPPGTVVTTTPSHCSVKARIYGRSAHAGVEPEKGISAIQVACRAVSRMQLGRIDEETTANIGYFSGGKVANAVPAYAELSGEARSMSEEKLDRQVEAMKRAFVEAAKEAGGRAEVEVERSFTGYRLPEDSPIVQVARDAAAAAGVSFQPTSRGGGSDANVFNQKGIPTINLGIGICDDHSPQESIAIADLKGAAKYLLQILQILSSQEG